MVRNKRLHILELHTVFYPCKQKVEVDGSHSSTFPPHFHWRGDGVTKELSSV